MLDKQTSPYELLSCGAPLFLYMGQMTLGFQSLGNTVSLNEILKINFKGFGK